MNETSYKDSKVKKLLTAEAQSEREFQLATRIVKAIAEYVRAGNHPTLKDAAIVERIAKNMAATLREQIGGEHG